MCSKLGEDAVVMLAYSPATAPEKLLDARVIAILWEPQEEGMMSTAASFPSVRNQGLIEPVGEESRF